MAELREVVAARGRERAAALRRDAEMEAARLRADAEAEVARKSALRIEETRVAIGRESGVRIAAARTAARQRVLLARQALLERVFAAAQRQLESAGSELASCEDMERALAELPDGPATLVCAPSAKAGVSSRLERPGLRIEVDASLRSGFRAVGADGRLAIDGTALARLERDWPRLAIEVLRRLEEGGVR